ncbi:Bug family tripartite tricarboxylate transporter substrate binding protein [Elioraea sp.]|uniref:Bug family tripartite tricarboxylate transporter substrate binding protein n=1 Tax=Elioraea sp. TaxID=2185103 RepID=UPI003F6E4F59
MLHRRRVLAAPLALAAAPLARPALAQAWPARTVRIIVPWPPAGSTDVLVRFYAERLQSLLGQSVVVENRPGAGGNIGVDVVAKSTPDGHTIGIAAVAHLSINPYLYARLAYDPQSLMLVGVAWELPNCAVVPAEHNPSRTLQEFIAWAKAKPDGITYGSPGVGTTPHLSGALFCTRVGIQGTHVPFRGAAQAIPVMLGGQLDFALDNLTSYVPVIREGRMRALAVTSAQRVPTMPDVPTMAEAGVPDFVVTSWQSFFFPPGTPPAVIQRMNAALKEISEDEAMRKRFLDAGAFMAWSTPEEATARAERERPMWREAVQISGARVE